MVKMTQTLDDGEAVVEIKYDTLGNIIEKTMPKGIDGKRMKFTYEYDKEHRMYPIRVTDAFGYRSDLFNYDYRYGIPLMVKDMNGFMTEYEIDDLGRVTKVTAPNELSSGAPYTILYHYGNADSVNFARTYHYDPQHPNDPMVTASIVDGLGRAYQVKKNAEVKGEREMIVSGLTTFDGLGREIAHFAPSTCSLNDWGRSSFDVSTKLDETVYDAFDRPLTQTAFSKNSGAYVSTTAYSIEDNMLKTTVEDNNGDSHLRMHTYMDGSERTLRTVKDHTASGDEPAPTTFVFDGINQLLFVIDAMNDTTAYTYDKAGRKLSVTHPSAGKTTFTYDNCGNVLSKETSKGKVEYKYEYNRLIEQTYGDDKWKNNVKYTYGGVDAKHNRVGRLALVEDGSGAQEYFYGKMGEVEKIRRTLIIPGVDVATYTTSWKYDSWNRIQEMVYPDGEKIKYTYNLGGQLTKIVGEKNYICTYIDDIQYDAYEQRSYMRYGNGSETHYEYDPVNRRLDNMKVSNEKSRAEGAEKGLFIDNSYSYDDAGNITQVSNSAALNMGIGGTMTHTYAYDDWYRLKSATGEFNSADKSKSAAYNLLMSYDNLYNIMSKKLTMSQTNLQFKGTLSAGHEFAYTYSDDNPMRLASVETKQYNLDKADVEADAELAKHVRTQNYEFDGNGNMTSVSVDTVSSLKSYLWDEENRLLAVNNNGSVSSYFYDAAGERTVKLSSESEMVHVNGRKVGSNAAITKFTAYVSPYFVVSNGGAYTKHIYAASQRIASKLGSIDGFGADPRRVEQAGDGKLKIDEKFQVQTGTIKTRHDSLGISYEQPKAKDEVEKDSAMDSSDPEKLVFFYHPDHLGSTSYVTDFDGNVTQHVEYIPYGEIFMEERNSSFSTPYLFNAKELDEETGLYYYGARYLNPMDAMWLSVDPMTEKYPGVSGYLYCLGNPIIIIDPDGKDVYAKKNSDSSLTYAVTGRRTSDTYTSDGDTYYKIDNTYDIRDSKGNLKGLPTRRNENSKQNYGTPIYGQSSVEEEQKTKAKNTGSPIDPEALPTAESGDIIEFFQYVLKKVGLFENEKKTIPKSGSDVTHYTDEKSEFDILGGTGPYKVGRYTYHTGDTMGIRRIRTTAIFKKTRLVHIRRDTTYTVKKPRKR
jgi:RHS repeat-associated protein